MNSCDYTRVTKEEFDKFVSSEGYYVKETETMISYTDGRGFMDLYMYKGSGHCYVRNPLLGKPIR